MQESKYKEHWHTIIIGAGAGGLFCAGSFPAPKLILEHNAIPGRKLNITGGGKCNFTHQPVLPTDYVCSHKHFPHQILAAYQPKQFTKFLEEQGIDFTLQENGCYFAKRAADITQMLYKRAKKQNTTFSFNTHVTQVIRKNEEFCVQTDKGNFYTQNLVLASGGISYPDLGATSLAWKIAKDLGLSVVEPMPALVGLRVDKSLRPLCTALAGNSVYVHVQTDHHLEKGQLLFTHEGFSGPVILQASLYWKPGNPITINFCPQVDLLAYFKEHKQEAHTFSKIAQPFLSPKISKILLSEQNVMAADATKQQLVQAANRLNHFTFIAQDTTGFSHAEVTRGGIDTCQLNPKTLQVKTVANLYFIGEAVDVTGRLGGYNLHWAWASAMAAAKNLM